ncbi:DUF4950 domain-containing protein [Enterococcus sp. BWR-S5]|uniref:DUF4950 domain-containing protein n=1 Tax=Enterococcus sp. BWR-S5 TaxID=2787714 RepID=UPI0019234334|nr:DUF4950 domain-containing protein [Enterococcus sp. BWR-S5]MBL1227627.1 DUF4950 domain-containing protein [Enterococcus sp. BWR-S5]
MKKFWKLFIFRLERDKKVRNDTILLTLSLIILLGFLGMIIFFNPQKEQAEKFKGSTPLSTVVGTSSTSTSLSSTESQQSTDTSATETSESAKPAQPSIEEFVGGWRISEDEAPVFFNPNETISSIALDGTIANLPMENLYLYYTEDGRSVLSYSENGIEKEWIKESDDTLSSEGQIFDSLGDLTIEQYLNGY